MRLLLAATAALLLVTAGCIASDDEPEPEVETASASTTENASEELALAGEGCWLGGGQSVHPREGAVYGNVSQLVPDPWRVADVLEDTGEQYTYSQWPKPTAPKPQEGDTWGHYHGSLSCETWTVDGEPVDELVFGFVGPKVKPPSFAPTDADDTYLATVIAVDDETVYERLQRGGVDAMHAELATERAGDQIAIEMTTDHNGDYLSAYRLNELGPIEDEHVRLWFQHENPDGTFRPIAIDIKREGGTHYGDAGEGYFHHERTAHHWPLPGAYGHTAAAHYEGFDVEIAWGPAPDVRLEERYVH